MPTPINSPLFAVQSLSKDTVIKLPPKPNAESASVKLYIVLAEKNIFVQGFAEEEFANKPSSMLRGSLFLRISKPVKIKTINLKFNGKSKTEWPEGIPPKKQEFTEKVEITQHQWLFYSHSQSFPASDDSINGADVYKKPNDSIDHITSLSLDDDSSSIRNSPKGMADRLKRAASPSRIIRPSSPSPMSRQGTGFLKHMNDSATDLRAFKSLDESSFQESSNGKFPPGDYIYNFELPIPSCLPETIHGAFGKVTYTLSAAVERLGTFKTNLYAEIPVNIVRTICEDSVEENEPIVVNKTWEEDLSYEVVIGSKLIPLNTYLPVTFRLVPLTKIQLHRIRVFATENMEYYCHNQKVHRMEPTKKYLLMEYKAPNGQSSLLEDDSGMIGMKMFEFEIYVPKKIGEHNKLHPDTSFQNIKSNHWLKVCLRVSKSDPQPDNPDKRKHFEISIDSPVQFLSELAVHANTLLPAYTESSLLGTSPHIPQKMSILPPLSPDVIAVDSLVGTVLQDPGIRLSSPNHHFENNLYKPDASNNPNILSSPQAQPYSPEQSPLLFPVQSAPDKPTSTKSPPSFESVMKNKANDRELPPSYESLVDKDSSRHSISRVLEEVDIGGSFRFQGLSPNLPDSIMRAVSPARGFHSTQNSRPPSRSVSRPASRPTSRPPSRATSRSASTVRGGVASTPNSNLSTASLATLNTALNEERGRRNRRPSLKPSKSNNLIDNSLDSLLLKGNIITKEHTPEEEIANVPATVPEMPLDNSIREPVRESYTASLVSVSEFSGQENDSADAVVKEFSMYRPRTGSSSTIEDNENGSTTSSPLNGPSIYQAGTTEATDPVSSLPLLHNSSAANVSESTIIPSEPFLKSEDSLQNALSNSFQSVDISTLLDSKEEGFWHSYAQEETPSWSNNLLGTIQSGSNSLYNRKSSIGIPPSIRIQTGFVKGSSDDAKSSESNHSDETTKE